MKNNLKILMLLMILSLKSFGQDSLAVKNDNLKTQIFSLSPISKKVGRVNGLVFGIGHVDNKNINSQTINGLNVELNPAPVAGALIGFLILVHLPEFIEAHRRPKDSLNNIDLKIKDWNTNLKLKVRGLNISSGCFFTTTDMDGLNISLANKFRNLNGISIAPIGTIADTQNGVCIGFVNANNTLNGLNCGIYNQSDSLNGVQIGVCNIVNINNGVQIGVFNKSYKRGLQIGIWNKNNKRSLPFINW